MIVTCMNCLKFWDCEKSRVESKRIKDSNPDVLIAETITFDDKNRIVRNYPENGPLDARIRGYTKLFCACAEKVTRTSGTGQDARVCPDCQKREDPEKEAAPVGDAP